MIQRIQSLLLLIVALLEIFFMFFPVLGFSTGTTAYVMWPFHTISSSTQQVVVHNVGIGSMGIGISIFSLLIIFLFRKRHLQIWLCRLAILLLLLQSVIIVVYSDVAEKTIALSSDDAAISIVFKLGTAIPVLALILLFLSINYIKKDIKLLQAADRLR